MSKITDIIDKYTVGVATLDETNVAPAEPNANIRLEPGKHELTAEEIAAASCTAFVNRYKAFAPGPAARTRPKTKTRTALRPWAKFFLDFWKCAPYNYIVNVSHRPSGLVSSPPLVAVVS